MPIHVTEDIATITSDTTLDNTHHVVIVDATSGNVTITLPAVSGIEGRFYHIKRTDSSVYTVTIQPDGSETIDGETSQTISQYDNIQITAGTEWSII